MSSEPLPGCLALRLDRLRKRGLERKLEAPQGTDFTSNDYLGFSADRELGSRFSRSLGRLCEQGLPLGSGGSRLLRGNQPLFGEVEAELARFTGSEDALLFPSGYQANVSLFSSLLQPGDRVFSDALNHASIIDGIRLSRAEKRIFPHRDLGALRSQLEACRLEASRNEPGLRLIVTESLFSMEGTVAPLRELATLAAEFGAELVVDEAHATGLWRGGLVETLGLRPQVLATVHTGGKALGAAGAWIASSSEFKRYLLNLARPAIFSTAPFPALAVLLRCAVDRWREIGPSRAETVLARAARFQRDAERPGPLLPGPIIPVIVGTGSGSGSNGAALEAQLRLRSVGLDVRAIRPPTVPEGSARLRVIVGWETPESELTRLAGELRGLRENEARERVS